MYPNTVYLSDWTSGFRLGVLETLTAFNVRFTIEPVLVETPDRTCEVDAEDLWFLPACFLLSTAIPLILMGRDLLHSCN